MGGNSINTGYVEVWVGDKWTAICGGITDSFGSLIQAGWTAASAAVACRQLGLPSSGAVNFTASSGGIGLGPGSVNGTVPYVYALVGCTGMEGKLPDCPHFEYPSSVSTRACANNDAGEEIFLVHCHAFYFVMLLLVLCD